jgi:2-keto-4-pentenoate hydratase
MEFSEQHAAAALWNALQRGEHCPSEWFDKLSYDQAYQVQLGLAARHEAAGARRIGWKVGLTSPAIQQQFGLTEPVFGYLLNIGLTPSGHQFRMGDLINPGLEPELCIRLTHRLAGDVDIGTVRAAVGACHPALEIVEARGDVRAQTTLVLADNAQQKAVVLGDAAKIGPDHAFHRVAARVLINGEEVAVAHGDAVLGDPLNSIAWLARKLASFGRAIEVGDLVMTGSFTRQFPLHAGDHVSAEFEGIGDVEVSISNE